jgi:hypothetical protein
MTDTPAQPKMHADVTYYSGVTVMSGTPAVIEWGADDRVRMWTVAAGQAPVLVFDVTPAEVTVKGYQAVLNLVIGGRNHRLDFAPTARLAMMGGVAGIAGAQAIAKNAGVPNWIAALRAGGAQVRYRSPWITFGITLGVVLVIVVIIVIVVAVTAFSGA